MNAAVSDNTESYFIVKTHFLNPLRAKFLKGKVNIYLRFVSFFHIDTTQVVEILPQIRQEHTYTT